MQAAKRNETLSRFAGQIVHGQMTDAHAYDAAMCRFLSEEPLEFTWTQGRRPTREALHDRDRLRRY